MISNCDDMRGMLPWLLNGTLEGDERRRVIQHLSACEACRRELADTRLAAEIFDQHLPAAAILALAWDETPQGLDPESLEEHLASCPRCAAELELARMSRRLEEEDKIVPLARRRTAPPAPATAWRGWKAAALAAGLAGVVAFSGWFATAGRVRTLEEQATGRPAAPAPAAAPDESARVRQLAAELEERGRKIQQLEGQVGQMERQATELSGRLDQLAQAGPATPAPQINAWAGTLLPSGDVVRGGEAGGANEIPGKTYATLLLTPTHMETHREHAVEIVDATGKVAWTASGLTRNADTDSYHLTLPPGTLRPGTYTIRVFGLADGRREPVESYSIRVK